MNKLAALGLVLVALLVAACVTSSSRYERAAVENPTELLDKGVEAFKRGDHRTAFLMLKPLADRGHSKAQTYVGFIYWFGRAVPRDKVRAMMWYMIASRKGDWGALAAARIAEEDMSAAEWGRAKRMAAAWRPRR